MCGGAVRGSEPSRVPGFASGMRPSLAYPRQPGGPSPGFSRVRPRRAVALLLFLLVWVSCCPLRSLRVALESCVPPLSSQSTYSCLTYPSLVMYFTLSVLRPLQSNFDL